jgi:hypothetical protein
MPNFEEALKPHLDRLLASRDPPKTCCPSEVTPALSSEELKKAANLFTWRDDMPETRRIIAEIRKTGEVEVLQKGCVLEGDLGEDLERVVGPIRIRIAL